MNHYLALLVSAYLATFGTLQQHSLEVNKTEWEAYKLEHGKHYADPQVDLMRNMIYARNKLEIDQFNQEAEKSFTLGVNHLTDLTEVELQSMMGFKVPSDIAASGQLPQNTPAAERFLRSILQDNSTGDLPEEWDWRKVPGRVSSVKDQGQCGSCWAFSTVGALEGQEAVRVNASLKEAINLSPQQLVDCDDKAIGCGGGWMSDAMDYIKKAGGMDDDNSYPYVAEERQCSFRSDKVAIKDSGYAILPSGDEQKLKEVVAKFGPVSVAMNIGLLLPGYKSGIFESPFCPKHPTTGDLDHAVLIVGYGTDKEKKVDYWIVKNSWSETWGENGYFRIVRNKNNHCGIATIPTIPTF